MVRLAGREVAIGRNWRNVPLIALVGLVGAACALSQAEAFGASTGAAGLLAARGGGH